MPRLVRFVRRLALICLALLLVFAVAFAGLLLVTPSVSNARQRAAAADRSDRAPRSS